MSRLDSFIRRLEAQRACLNLAATSLREVPGPVLELGLGNGRTYDHLRELMPTRRIFVFERQVAAHPASTPDPDHLILGDIRTTLPAASSHLPGPAALVHSDIGTGDPAYNGEMAGWLGEALPPLLADGAWLIADQPMAVAQFERLAPPAGVASDRYFLYQYHQR